MKKYLLILLLITVSLSSKAQIIKALSGNGVLGYSGDGGFCTASQMAFPTSAVFDKFGNVYVSEYGNHIIRKINTLGIISTYAGTGTTSGFSGDGGLATAAKLFRPTGLAMDTAGNLYICDHGNNRIRKVSKTGIITTIAGTGSATFSGDGSLATLATLNNPIDVCVDIAGNIYIADQINYRVRKINTSGIISTIAGSGTSGYSGDGGLAISAKISNPYSVEVDGNGNVYIADYSNFVVRKVSSTGIISTLAGTGVSGYSGDGGSASLAQMSQPSAVCADSKGNVFVSDMNNQRIRKINSLGVISTVIGNGQVGNTGDGGLATSAKLGFPSGLSVDSAGVICFADYSNNRARIVCPSNCPIVTGISDNNNELQILIYPNPNHGKFNIVISEDDVFGKVEIWNMLGQEILSQQIETGKTLIQFPNEIAGIYQVRITTKSGLTIQKISVE